MIRTIARTLVVFVLSAVVGCLLYLALASHAAEARGQENRPRTPAGSVAPGPRSSEPRAPAFAEWGPPAVGEQGPSALAQRHGGRGGHAREGQMANGGRGHGHEEASLGRGLAGVGVTTLQVGFVGAAVVAAQAGCQRYQRRRRTRA